MFDGVPNTGPFFFVGFYEAMDHMMRSTDLPVEGPTSRHALA